MTIKEFTAGMGETSQLDTGFTVTGVQEQSFVADIIIDYQRPVHSPRNGGRTHHYAPSDNRRQSVAGRRPPSHTKWPDWPIRLSDTLRAAFAAIVTICQRSG